MTPGECCVENCTTQAAAKDDVFCAEHWRALPRWARTQLVQLRNAARRTPSATTNYVKALIVASTLKA